MTVSSTTTKNSYAGDGSTTAFSYTFKIFDEDDITVVLRNNSTGAETTQTITTNYTVSGVGNAGGGTVTFVTAPPTGNTVVLLRITPLTQLTDYTPNDPFPAESHEDALDKLTFITQELQEEVGRSLKLSQTNEIATAEFTTGATARANKILGFDADGDLAIFQEIGTFKGSDATTTTADYVERDIVKSTTAAQLDNVYIALQDSPTGTLLTNTTYWALLVDAVSAATSATNAAASASAASTSETNAATSETNAAASYDSFDDRYLGAKASDPALDNDGDSLITGALYFNTTDGDMRVYNGSAWINVVSSLGNLANIVEDATPQLGGDLDINGQSIVSTSNADINITPDGTGNVTLGTLAFDADQTVGAGQDDYVLTYDNASGTISLEASAGGDVVNDLTPQLGGTLDVNNQLVQFADSTGATDNRLQLGTGQDMQLYHDGTTNKIDTSAAQELHVNSDDVLFYDNSGTTRTAIVSPGSTMNFQLYDSTGTVRVFAVNGSGNEFHRSVYIQDQRSLGFKEDSANGSNYVGFQAPASVAANVVWTLPDADGTSGQRLQTDGSGTLTWADEQDPTALAFAIALG
jgi:hypothetical protein